MVETRRAKKRKGDAAGREGEPSSAAASGTAELLFETMRAMQKEMTQLQRKIGRLEKRVGELEEEKEGRRLNILLEERVGELEEEKEDFGDRLNDLSGEVEENQKCMAKLESDVWKLDCRADVMEGDLLRVQDDIEKAEEKIDARQTEMDEKVETAEAKIDALRTEMEGKIEQLENQVDAKIEALEETKVTPLAERIGELEGAPIKAALKHVRNMIMNRNWENPVPSVPSSYWTSNGYGAGVAEVMEDWVEVIRDETKQMRVGGLDGTVDLGVPGTHGIVPHDDVMMPQWEEFANALKEYRHFVRQADWDGLWTSFSVERIELPRQVLGMLEDALDGDSFDIITLERNGGGHDLIAFLVKVLGNNARINSLCWRENPIEEGQDYAKLLGVISGHPSLDVLSIVNSCHGLSYNTITSALSQCTNLRDLDLSNNSIVSVGNNFLERYLTANNALRVLRLKDNGLTDFDATCIARALKINTELLRLNVEGNNFSEKGMNALLKAVFNDSTLNSVAGSNHCCEIQCDSEWTSRFNKLTRGDNASRRQKLYFVLSSRNKESSNVLQLGAKLDPKHMPILLDSVQKYSDFEDDDDSRLGDVVPPLSIVYEILRGWNMPCLFEKSRSS